MLTQRSPDRNHALQGAVYEPNVRSWEKAKDLTAKVYVSGLMPKSAYTVYRYDGTDALPAGPPFDVGYSYATAFTATATTYSFEDPNTFKSSSAVYYVAVANGTAASVEEK